MNKEGFSHKLELLCASSEEGLQLEIDKWVADGWSVHQPITAEMFCYSASVIKYIKLPMTRHEVLEKARAARSHLKGKNASE